MTSVADSAPAHPRLKRPLVAEALLEIRYPRNDQTYLLAPGRLFEKLGSDFPRVVDLVDAKFPMDMLPPEVVRHRLVSPDEKRLVQFGPGVLSINTTDYLGFEDFKNNCEKVLIAAQAIGMAKKVERLGLRFINKTILDRDANEITTVKINRPDYLKPSVIAHRYQWITQHGYAGQLSTTIAWPIADEATIKQPQLAIDLDQYKDILPSADMDIADILRWLRDAHNNIFTAFKSLLQPAYFSELEDRP